VFGGLTLFFDDPRWIKAKPTFVNVAFAAALLGGLALRKSPLKALLGSTMRLPDEAWRTLTIRYAVFFLAVAVANEAVWRTQPDGIWALWRFPGLQLLALAFTLTQLPLMMHQMKQVAPEDPPPVQ
jgi:intracellular septation protein